MSLISFIREAGEKLFRHSPNGSAAVQPDIAALNATAGHAIEKYIGTQNLTADGLSVTYDGATETATVRGVAPDQATKEKIVLCCGNVSGVSKVEDLLTVAAGDGSTFIFCKGRFWVPSVHMRRSALGENMNNVFGLGWKMGRLGQQ